MKLRLAWLALAAALGLSWWWLSAPQGTPAAAPPDWRADPVQRETSRQPFAVPTRKGPVTLIPRAEYAAAAVVGALERYRLDASAFLSPADLVLLWGDLPAEPYRSRLSILQTGRAYIWKTRSRELDAAYIEEHSANVHLLPATSNLRRAALALGAGDVIRVRGLLVDVRAPDGFVWTTSLSRTDSGAGACEVLWLEELQAGAKVYR